MNDSTTAGGPRPVKPGSRIMTSRSVFLTVFPSVMLPMFLAVVDQTIVATALPAIAANLGEIKRASWVVVSYLIAATIAAPVYGRFGDTFGRRRMMLIALTIFIAASVMCALAPSVEVLTATRVLQGLGGGGLMTLSQALVGEAIPPRQRGRYQGYLAAVAVSSNTFGPVAGGYLTETMGWPSIFLVNVPIGLVAIVLVYRMRSLSDDPSHDTDESGNFDSTGLFLFASFIASIILSLEQIQHMDSEAIGTVAALVALGVISLILLWRREQRTAFPLLPISLLKQPTVWRSDALAACHGAALVSLITFLPIYLRAVHGASPGQIGLLMVPLTVGIGVGSMITGRIVSRTGCTMIIPFYGLIVVTSILLFLGIWAPHLNIRELPWIFGVNALFMGTVMGVVQVTVQAAAGPRMLGAGAATVQFSRSVGAAFGTAVVAAVLFSVLEVTDRAIAAQFGTIVQQGPDVMLSLAPEQQAAMKSVIGNAFRAAFVAIAGFTGLGIWLAWSVPLRRV